ncbi:MAG TPA: hypothetical protein CFH84_10355 [Sulfurimonas sp. UBA12504]|nr:MAG TPA: hypothetical protein CFH84_10355 [Sulfurimonas sp. UBA12504]
MFETRAQTNQEIFEYIEVSYNKQRMHSFHKNYHHLSMKKKCYLEKQLLRMLYSVYDIGLTD